MIALHAHRSHPFITEFRKRHPHAPLVVMLTGTDLYRPQGLSRQALRSLELADRLVVINNRGIEDLPAQFRGKTHVILQSVEKPVRRLEKYADNFGVCLSGHLRAEKDPFLTLDALQRVPAASRIFVRHVGAALGSDFELRAREASESDARYRWYGEVPRWRAREILARSELMVITSLQEGGAHVISEAISASVPVLASRIPGNVGLLGEDYGGYFPARDAAALAALLLRAEQDVKFLQNLRRQIVKLSAHFLPKKEAAAWENLFNKLI